MKGLLLAFVLAMPMAGHAQESFGDWSVEVVDSDTIGAYTTNSNGTVFGKLCFVSSQNCIWIISAVASCNAGELYAALSNSASGSYFHDLTCIGGKKIGQLMTFGSYEQMEAISKNDDFVGFAIPMLGGQFRVSRFSLTGSVTASQAAEQAVIEAAKSKASEYDI